MNCHILCLKYGINPHKTSTRSSFSLDSRIICNVHFSAGLIALELRLALELTWLTELFALEWARGLFIAEAVRARFDVVELCGVTHVTEAALSAPMRGILEDTLISGLFESFVRAFCFCIRRSLARLLIAGTDVVSRLLLE